jgi:hypothetical protein
MNSAVAADASINIISISVGSSSPQNSIPVIVSFDVNVPPNRGGICGLSASNFRLKTLSKPATGPDVVITSITQLDSSRVPHTCYYWIRVAPATNHGIQPKWVKGTYNIQLDYIKNLQTAGSKAFSFTV